MQSIFKLTDLQQRKEPKRQKDFAISYAVKKIHIEQKKENTEEDNEEYNKENDDDGPRESRESREPREPIKGEAKESHNIKFNDKRKSTLIDRNLILQRLHRPVENKKISKSPVIDEEPNQKKQRISEKEQSVKKSRSSLQGEEEDFERKPQGSVEEEQKETTTGSILDEDSVPVRPSKQEEEEQEDHAVAVLSESDEGLEELEGEPEEQTQGKKEKQTGKKRAKKEGIKEDIGRVNLSIAKIGDQLITDRLPPKSRYTVPVSKYYMNNRKIFIEKLAQIFKPYSDKIASKASELSCKTLHNQSINFELLTHQLIVRSYLNLYTPYRGILLYHGLGSGKTCTSIGIAEGMKSSKQIVLMTPASLKMNFFNELKKCGDVLYKKNQNWEFISLEGDIQRAPLLSQALGLDVEYIRKHKGAWLMNVKKQPNFSELSDNDQKNVDRQIDQMIRNKYIDINYNGLRKEHIDKMTKNGKVNPFDNKVVIIDEVHNLVSRIANTGKSKGSIAYRLYHDIMDATNAKIIFLTGTPIINTPREIAILFNMLRGSIKTWTFSLETTTSDKINTEVLLNSFRSEGLTMYDYVEYTTNKLVVTRNPFGFVNVYKKREPEKAPTRKEEYGQKKETKKVGQKGGQKGGKGTKTKHHKTINKKTKKIYEEIYDDDDDIEKEYDRLQLDLYEGGGALDEYAGVRLDEMGNISDNVFETRLTRILKYKDIRIVGKPKIVKELALPDDADVFNERFIDGDKGELINTDVLKRRILGLTSYFRSAQEQLLPSFVTADDGTNYHILNIDMSDYQFEEYEKIRKDERTEEKRKKKRAKMNGADGDDMTSTYRIYSRSACNFVFPGEHPRPRIKGKEEIDFDQYDEDADDHFEDVSAALPEEEGIEGAKAEEEEEEKEEKELEGAKAEEPEEKHDVDTDVLDYQSKISKTYEFLKYDPTKKRSKEYLTDDGLKIYSPKFRTILHNITDERHKGLHLIYSQFRTLEGIGLFKLVLEANGYLEFKVNKRGEHWEITDWEKNPEKPRYALYTGTETSEEKDIIRNIFNGSWNLVPPSIVEKIRERNADNLYGEVIKVLMITASGAEGINLRNTRYVHIMEPYWNMVRVDQVVGRARRICSHEDLPEELRTVEVFIYLSCATPVQIEKNIEIKINDLSKLTYKTHDEKRGREILEHVPFTTDQYLLEIAQIKDSITRQILKVVKETAIDCSLYNNNPQEPLVCYGFGQVEPQSFASYPTLERDAQEKTAVKTETKKSLAALSEGGVKYAVDKNTWVVYDFASYELAKAKRGQLVAIGKYDTIKKKIIFS